MNYTPPTKEQLFVLEHIADIDALTGHEKFAHSTSDVVEAIAEGLGQFAAQEYAPLNRDGDTIGAKWDDGKVTMPPGFREAYQSFVETGFGAIDGPEEFGGQDLPFTLAALALENLGTANMGFSLVNMLTPGSIESLIAHGSQEQKERWLPKLLTGEWTGTMNLTEPQAGSDVGALRTTAAPITDGPDAGKYKIKGTKIYITFGEHDLTDNIIHLVLARTPDAPEGTRGISLFIVPKKRVAEDGSIGVDNDVRCVSIEHKLGIHASPTCVLSFGDNDDCIGEMVGQEFGGMRAMFTMMNNARLNVGSQGVQIGERATQQAMAYAQERIQSAKAGADSRDPVAIIEHADVRRMLLRMKAGTQAARVLLYYACSMVDRKNCGDDAAKARLELLTPLVKAYGTDMGCEIASLGVQVHGGMGFVEETGAAQHYRDIRIAPIYEGTNGIQAADLVGRKLPMDGGAVIESLLADIRADMQDETALAALLGDVEEAVNWMRSDASVDDRMAGSYPVLTMLSVLTCGWLMLRQHRIAAKQLEAGQGDSAFLKAKRVTTRYYLDQMVPEARGLKAAAMGGAELLYSLSADELAG